ncbi:hypothetical protein WG78_15670 [Amantichitinum ursilacus]|uniref:Uncharacterized protein n=1 Tax=Amantichitinum ursilacus TaxID=857265 RepID=A0A0N1JS88_9NEIS|nr:hypothetical protein WG78_15670 [Amantichitinum ursilacus]
MLPTPLMLALSMPMRWPATSCPLPFTSVCALLALLLSWISTCWPLILPSELSIWPRPVMLSVASAKTLPPWLSSVLVFRLTSWPCRPCSWPWVARLLMLSAVTLRLSPAPIRLPLLSMLPPPTFSVALCTACNWPPRLSMPLALSCRPWLAVITPPAPLLSWPVVAVRSVAAPIKPALLFRSPLCSVMPLWLMMPSAVPDCVLVSVWPWLSMLNAPVDWIRPAVLFSAPLCTPKVPRAPKVPCVLSRVCVPAFTSVFWPTIWPCRLFRPLLFRVSACAASIWPSWLLRLPVVVSVAASCTEPILPCALFSCAAEIVSAPLLAILPPLLSSAFCAVSVALPPAVIWPPPLSSVPALIVLLPAAARRPACVPSTRLSSVPLTVMPSAPACAACSVPPRLSRLAACRFRSPFAPSVPPVLVSAPVTVTLAAPLPYCAIWPLTLDSAAAVTCSACALTVPPSSTIWLPCNASVPLLMIWPLLPSTSPPPRLSVPLPACCTVPLPLFSCAVLMLRLAPLLPSVPLLLSIWLAASVVSPLPVCSRLPAWLSITPALMFSWLASIAPCSLFSVPLVLSVSVPAVLTTALAVLSVP